MRFNERRKLIPLYLENQDKPVKAVELAKIYGVSRQIIVGDITALKEEGYEIASTHFGYLLKKSPLKQRVIKVRHDSERTQEELNAIVALGGIVLDVFVKHKVYGKLSAALNIIDKKGVNKFMEGVRKGKSSELMNITDGYHYHTIRAETKEILDNVENKLKELNFLVEND